MEWPPTVRQNAFFSIVSLLPMVVIAGGLLLISDLAVAADQSLGGTNASRKRAAGPYLSLQQEALEGYCADNLDLADVHAVFWHVFSRLPDEVTVYPSENYLYWVLHVSGRQVWGNIRLPAGQREQGVLSFGYAEFVEFPSSPTSYLSLSKFFTKRDGVRMEKRDRFTWRVTYRDRAVIFHLHQLRTDPPKSFQLAAGEAHIERTFDESGLQFFLLFNTDRNYFFWVLNEEEKVPEQFINLAPDILLGRRTGFAFWVDAQRGGRKVLAAVRKISVLRNDYYDGPFDQLADNYVEVNRISEWMERAFPSLKGCIDRYGYYADSAQPSRVALSCYGSYYTHAEIIEFIKQAKSSQDPYQYISRGGAPLP